MGKFKIGDSVRLKTDRSETMVVSGFHKSIPVPTFQGHEIVHETESKIDETRVICSWHDKQGKPQQQTYNEDALEIANADTPLKPYVR